MRTKEIAQSILEEEVSHSIRLYRICLYLVTAILWLVWVAMLVVNARVGLFAIWQFVLIGAICLYLTALTLAIKYNTRVKQTLRQKLELRLRIKFHWFF